MSISMPRRRTRNVLAAAFMLSIAMHLVGGALWPFLTRTVDRIVPKMHAWASLQEPPVLKTEVIRIERPAKPVVRAAHENRVAKVAPRPHPVVAVAPAIVHPRHEIARIGKNAPAQAPAAAPRPLAQSVDARVTRHTTTVALAPAADNRPALSDRQIAALGADFSKTIAESRETLAGVQAASEAAPVATIKHYAIHFSGIHEGMNPGDGEIFPIKKWRKGDEMWYYARYTYLHGDGTYEADDIPWPLHYPIGNDPFARHDKRVPIQPPPAGYKPDRPLKPILERYFGGPPVTD